MKSFPRMWTAAALIALLGVSGCVIDPGHGGRNDSGRDRGSSRGGDDRNDRDCRNRDDERCRDQRH